MKERAYPVYTVNKHAEGLLVGGHPWVYENDILHSPENEPENGTLADVVSTKGSYLGTGFVSLKSKIRVRLISRNANDTFDAAFWRRRVEYAWNYRKTVLEPADLSACRVIFGEADQFPGLTVDRFSNIRQAPRPRSARTEFTIMWISRTARRPASSLIRSTTAGRWHALLQVTPCWTALPTPAALH